MNADFTCKDGSVVPVKNIIDESVPFEAVESGLRECGLEGIQSSLGMAVDIRYWIANANSISVKSVVVNNKGTNVTNWPSAITTAVNGPFFPMGDDNKIVNAFAINDGNPVLTHLPWSDKTNGSQNWLDIYGSTGPLDFIMDPRDRALGAYLAFGNGGTFPIINSISGLKLAMGQIRWGLGGFDLEMRNTSLDNPNVNFANNWKWGYNGSPSSLVGRTAIGYVGGGLNPEYIIAASLSCTMYDIRMFMKNKGCSYYGLYLDGSFSTQVRTNGNVLLRPKEPKDLRNVPVVVSFA